MVYFILYGDEFPTGEVTETLGIQPTKSYIKGDEIRHDDNPAFRPTSPLLRKRTAWELGTDYQETYDIADQLEQVLVQLRNKEVKINLLKDKYNLKCQLVIVLNIERGYTPGFNLNNEQIEFTNSIKAEFNIDLYANAFSYDDDEEIFVFI